MGFGKRTQPVGRQLSAATSATSSQHCRHLLLRELVLPHEATEGDPYRVVHCTVQYLNYMLYTAHYLPDEMLPEPMWSYQVDYYLSQVNNGGHRQYV